MKRITWCDSCCHANVCSIRYSYTRRDEIGMQFCDEFKCLYETLCVVCGRPAIDRFGFDVREQCCEMCRNNLKEEEDGE